MRRLVWPLICIGIWILFFVGASGEGTRSGMIVNISHVGIITKTWEGELMIGSGNSGRSWYFNATDGVAAELQAAEKNRDMVTLHYQKRIFVLPWRGDTFYFVDRIEKQW